MSVDLSTLTAYTEENSGILISKALLGATIMDNVTVKPGFSAGTVAINVLDLDGLTFSASSCGWADAGTVSFSQVEVTVDEKQLKFSMCPADFRDYWLSSQLNPSALGEVVPFEQFIADETVKKVQREVDRLVCTAITTNITTGNGAIIQGGTPSGWVVGTALDQAQALVTALPTEILDRDDLTMYMSYASYRALIMDMVNENLFHYAPANNSAGVMQPVSMVIPGSNVIAKPFAGWTTGRVICGPKSMLIAAVGLLTDEDQLKVWYSQDNDEVRFLAKFRVGLNGLAEYFSTNSI